jgi:hypothetical protein
VIGRRVLDVERQILLLRMIVALAACGSLAGCSGTGRALKTVPSTSHPNTTTTGLPQHFVVFVRPCLPSDLQVRQGRSSWTGFAGGVYVSLDVRNVGHVTCSLNNTLAKVTLTGSDGAALPTHTLLQPTPSPPVLVAPHSWAVEDLDWENWCSSSPGGDGVSIVVPGTGVLSAAASTIPEGQPVPGTTAGTTASCNNPAKPSAVQVPFSWNGGPSAP